LVWVDSLACRRLRVALIRNGMGIFALFSIVMYCFMNYVVEPFELRFSLIVVLGWGRGAKIVEQSCWIWNNFPLRYKWIFDQVVLINSNLLYLCFKSSVTFRFTSNTLIICIIYICWENGVLQFTHHKQFIFSQQFYFNHYNILF